MCAQCVESNGVGQLLVLVFSSQKLPGHRLEVALDVLLEARRLGGACLGLLELREERVDRRHLVDELAVRGRVRHELLQVVEVVRDLARAVGHVLNFRR